MKILRLNQKFILNLTFYYIKRKLFIKVVRVSDKKELFFCIKIYFLWVLIDEKSEKLVFLLLNCFKME